LYVSFDRYQIGVIGLPSVGGAPLAVCSVVGGSFAVTVTGISDYVRTSHFVRSFNAGTGLA
jgi:hypothetical protein